MSLTSEGSLERVVLNDAKRGKLLNPNKEDRKAADYDLW